MFDGHGHGPDAAKRLASGDPDPSIGERYGTRAGYVRQVEAAGRKLQEEGFPLSEDVDRFIGRAQGAASRPPGALTRVTNDQ